MASLRDIRKDSSRATHLLTSSRQLAAHNQPISLLAQIKVICGQPALLEVEVWVIAQLNPTEARHLVRLLLDSYQSLSLEELEDRLHRSEAGSPLMLVDKSRKTPMLDLVNSRSSNTRLSILRPVSRLSSKVPDSGMVPRSIGMQRLLRALLLDNSRIGIA